jgi:hypothetical protein
MYGTASIKSSPTLNENPFNIVIYLQAKHADGTLVPLLLGMSRILMTGPGTHDITG